MGLKLNGIHQFLVCLYDSLWKKNINAMNKKHRSSILVSSLEVGLEVNAKKMGVYSCLITTM